MKNQSLLRVKEESEKPSLKLNIKKTKIVASGPITSWQIQGEKVEAVTDFLLGSKITADGDCSREIKKTIASWQESYDKPRQHIKSRDITLPTKVRLVKTMIFPVVMSGCESWTIKKAEHRRIDADVVLKKTLESPLDSEEIKPVNPKRN